MTNKFYKILSSLSLITFLAVIPATTISCSKTQNIETNDLKSTIINQQYENDLEWENFIRTEYIQTILDLVYENNEIEKDKYIQQQKQLNTYEYLTKLQTYLSFTEKSFSTFSLNWKYKKVYDENHNQVTIKPMFIENADKILNSIISQNWLWFLYNINKFRFFSSDSSAGNEAEANKKFINYLTKALDYGNFYQPKSNKILQYGIHKDSSNTNVIYALRDDGFINYLTIDKTDYTDLPIVNINTYFFTYPAILESNYKNDFFNINSFIQFTKDFSSPDYTSKNLVKINKYKNKLAKYEEDLKIYEQQLNDYNNKYDALKKENEAYFNQKAQYEKYLEDLKKYNEYLKKKAQYEELENWKNSKKEEWSIFEEGGEYWIDGDNYYDITEEDEELWALQKEYEEYLISRPYYMSDEKPQEIEEPQEVAKPGDDLVSEKLNKLLKPQKPQKPDQPEIEPKKASEFAFIFEDFYGGNPLQYSLFDVDLNKK